MTGHKFTDDDVIKALEVCASGDPEACAECPYEPYPCKYASRDALALINRQKAEIERLIKANNRDDLQHKYCNLIEDVLVYSKSLEDYNKFRKSFKAEAIKEFAERLKVILDGKSSGYLFIPEIRFDNLVNEMTEK